MAELGNLAAIDVRNNCEIRRAELLIVGDFRVERILHAARGWTATAVIV